MDRRLLEGDTALVTAAGGGIGRGVAAALEAGGARVFYVTGATIAVDGGIALHNWIDP